MEASKLTKGVHYAFRTATRGSRWGNDYRQRALLVRDIGICGRSGYRQERELCEKHSVKRCWGLVQGKAMLLMEHVDPATLEGNGERFICSAGCITSTWLTHVESKKAADEAHVKRVAEQEARKAAREAANEKALQALVVLNDDLMNLLAMEGAYNHSEPDPVTGDWKVAISFRDLAVLVENAVEVCGGRP